jgi:hypothetical protein
MSVRHHLNTQLANQKFPPCQNLNRPVDNRYSARRQFSKGEDSAAYHELLERVSGDVKPTDIVEKIWIHDVVDLTWEIFRRRRLRTSLIAAAMLNKLEAILVPLVRRRSARNEETEGFPELNLNFTPRPPSPEEMLANKLVKKWIARDLAVIERVNKLLASVSITIDTVMARAFVEEFENIERIDRSITIAEGRRNTVLREIDRHRLTFAHALRETVQSVEEAEFKVIESKARHD